MNAYTGNRCPKCGKGHQDYLRLPGEWEDLLRKKWGQELCEPCKREVMIGHIKRGAAVPGDLPGYQPTTGIGEMRSLTEFEKNILYSTFLRTARKSPTRDR